MKKALPYSSELMYYLGLMLHYVPERRMTLAELFSCRLLSGEVANISGKLSLSINRIPLSGKNTLKPIKLAQRSENELLKVS